MFGIMFVVFFGERLFIGNFLVRMSYIWYILIFLIKVVYYVLFYFVGKIKMWIVCYDLDIRSMSKYI